MDPYSPVLASWLRHVPLQAEDVFLVARRIAESLASAQATGQTFGDLHPDNIEMSPSVELRRGSSHRENERLYLAPEQLRGGEPDLRSDVFSYGVIVREMIAAATTGSALLDSVRDRVVARCLAEDPEQRWQNAGEVVAELDRIASRKSTQDLYLVIVTPDGSQHPVEAPAEIEIGEFTGELLEGLQLPRVIAEGEPTLWQLHDVDTARMLRHGATLEENGVRYGHHIAMRRIVLAGGSPERSTVEEDFLVSARGKRASLATPPEVSSSVKFTVSHPKKIQPGKWQTVLAYAHLPSLTQEVQSMSRQRLGPLSTRNYSDSHAAVDPVIARGAEVRIVPHAPGCRFNPPSAVFLWLEDIQCAEFRLQADSDLQSSRSEAVCGSVSFYVGPILIAEAPIRAQLTNRDPADAIEERPAMSTFVSTVEPYQAVFVSYARQDAGIVDQLERAYAALGFDYLRDIRVLRSGEKWNPALLRKIEEADIFQLCWSKAAKASANVEQEWRHAMRLNRTAFVRPLYWEQPMPEPPEELRDIHFARLAS